MRSLIVTDMYLKGVLALISLLFSFTLLLHSKQLLAYIATSCTMVCYLSNRLQSMGLSDHRLRHGNCKTEELFYFYKLMASGVCYSHEKLTNSATVRVLINHRGSN